ncbi:MAG TPA: hypothetical protein VIL74_10875 [Pyrinomonadaceae bacterium]
MPALKFDREKWLKENSFSHTLENRTDLPRLSGGENLKSGQQKQMRSDENKYKYEVDNRKESSAFVYFDKPNGERTAVWSDRSFSIVKSKESGARLQFAQKSNDYLSLAKRFLKAVRKIK